MTAIVDSRKRSREEDGSDFMPLSKRITNLHINPSSSPMQSDNDITDYNMNLNESHQTNHSLHIHNQFASFNQPNGDFSHVIHPSDEQDRQLQYQQYLNECNNANSSNGSSCTNISANCTNGNHIMEPYDPELSQKENPFYYSKNKLLYDLFLERLSRHQ